MSGVTASAMSGLGKVFWQKENVDFHITPVDFVVNTAIVAAFRSAKNTAEVSFYNSTISPSNSVTFENVRNFFEDHRDDSPPYENLYWYPGYRVQSNFFIYTLMTVLIQLIPAAVFDVFCLLCNKKAL